MFPFDLLENIRKPMVNNFMFTNVIFLLLLKYNMVFKKMVEKTPSTIFERKTLLWEEFLGSLACEPNYYS